MMRHRTTALAVLVLSLLGTVAVSSASAVEGVLPLSPKKTFTFLGQASTFEDTSGGAIKCSEVKGSGQYENDSHGAITLDFLGCEIAGFPVFSLGEKEPKEVKEALILWPALFLVCLVKPAELRFGIYVELKEPVHLHEKTIAALVIVEGAMIGELFN